MIITIRFDDVINDNDSSKIDNDIDDDSIGNWNDDDADVNGGNGDDIYIMMQCLSVTKNEHFLKRSVCLFVMFYPHFFKSRK